MYHLVYKSKLDHFDDSLLVEINSTESATAFEDLFLPLCIIHIIVRQNIPTSRDGIKNYNYMVFDEFDELNIEIHLYSTINFKIYTNDGHQQMSSIKCN